MVRTTGPNRRGRGGLQACGRRRRSRDDAEEEDPPGRRRRAPGGGGRRRTSSTACAASRRRPGALPSGRRGRRAAHRRGPRQLVGRRGRRGAAAQSPRADDAASLSDDGTGASASYSADFLPEPDAAETLDDAPPSDDGREETPAQSRARRLLDDFAPAAGTPALLTVADLGDWSGAADDAAPAPPPPSSPQKPRKPRRRPRRARRWSSARTRVVVVVRGRTPPTTPPRDDSSYEDDFAPDTASPRISQEEDAEEPRSPGTTGLAVGTLVEVIYGDTDEWFPGTIEAANADGTYAVAYDDGDREPRVDAAFVRVVLHGGASSSSSSGSSYATTSDDETSEGLRDDDGGAARTRGQRLGLGRASASAAALASSPRRADSEYSEDFAEDDAARPIDERGRRARRAARRSPRAGADARRRGGRGPAAATRGRSRASRRPTRTTISSSRKRRTSCGKSRSASGVGSAWGEVHRAAA